MIDTGYFAQNELSVDDFLQSMKNPLLKEKFGSNEELYANAQIFVNGSCHLFAYALHEKYRYNIVEIRSLICVAHCHFFCCTEIDGQIIYFDVRGATTNYDEFFCGLGYKNKEDYNSIMHSYEELDEELSEEGAEFGYIFAKHIIELHSEYYDAGFRKDG